jgi:hypothetical protein
MSSSLNNRKPTKRSHQSESILNMFNCHAAYRTTISSLPKYFETQSQNVKHEENSSPQKKKLYGHKMLILSKIECALLLTDV